MDSKHYYNPNGEEILDEGIFGGSPSGFVDFNRSKYKWGCSSVWNPLNISLNYIWLLYLVKIRISVILHFYKSSSVVR